VAHGGTAVANQARHLCGGRVRGKERSMERASKRHQTETDKEDRDREAEMYDEKEYGWCTMNSL